MALTSPARSGTLPKTLVILGVLFVLPLLSPGMRVEAAITTGMIYAGAAVGLDVFAGYTGILSICGFGFVAIGAYTSAVLTTHYKWSSLTTLPASIVAACLVAAIVGSVVVRLRDLGSALATFFFAFLVAALVAGQTLSKWTGSASGIPVGELRIGSTQFAEGSPLYYLSWTVLLVLVLVSSRYVNSRAGRALRVIKRSETVASSLGINVYVAKLVSFVFAAGAAGAAGFVYAQSLGYLSPDSFSGIESVYLLAMVVIGGMGSLGGPILGAVGFTLLSELSRQAGAGRQMLFAVVLLVVLIFAPKGLYGVFDSKLWDSNSKWVAARFHPLRRRKPEDRPGSVLSSPAPLRSSQISADENILEISGVGVRFGGVVALNQISLSVPRSSVFAIMGPNGAGKTTLLNCISGIERHSGWIALNKLPLSGQSPRHIRRMGITRTFQHPSLVDDLTVNENVQLGSYGIHPTGPLRDVLPLASTRRWQREAELIAKRTLDLVGFPEQRRDLLAAELTQAEQKLVDVARALAGDPVVLLLDEPTAGLDQTEMDALQEVIRRVRDQTRVTILVIAHHVGFLRGIADYAVVMDFGQEMAFGLPDEVLSRRDVAVAFLGESNG